MKFFVVVNVISASHHIKPLLFCANNTIQHFIVDFNKQSTQLIDVIIVHMEAIEENHNKPTSSCQQRSLRVRFAKGIVNDCFIVATSLNHTMMNGFKEVALSK